VIAPGQPIIHIPNPDFDCVSVEHIRMRKDKVDMVRLGDISMEIKGRLGFVPLLFAGRMVIDAAKS
jgi:hypothetical protein